jgi:PilZ domain/Putative zinc-finger
MHTSLENLELYALGELPDDLSSQVETHLQSCVDCGVQFEETRLAIGQWNGPENRKSPRVATDDPAALTVLKPEQSARVQIRIVNASKEGLRLRIPHELLTGAIVQIHVRGLFILAEVRYCIEAGESFYAGVEIHDVFPACG